MRYRELTVGASVSEAPRRKSFVSVMTALPPHPLHLEITTQGGITQRTTRNLSDCAQVAA